MHDCVFGITNAMFTSISSFHTVADDIASFLHMALLEQKSLQQFLTFRPREAQFIEDMENTLLSVLQELARHDIATPLIVEDFLTRVFFSYLVLSMSFHSPNSRGNA